MAKCPECGAEIDHVNVFVTEENKYSVDLQDGALNWSTSEVVEGSGKGMTAECPECHMDLFTHEGETGGD